MRRTDRAVILDLDGTLVDSVFHHVVAWQQALADFAKRVPTTRIHAAIGMGTDRLLPWVLGEHVVTADEIAQRHRELFLELTSTLQPTPGARALLADLAAREVPHFVATSAGEPERRAMLDVLDRGDLPVVDAGDVPSSKPAPDLLLAACDRLNVDDPRWDAVLVGDSPWDARAAARIGMPCLLVRCGGFGDRTLAAAAPEDVVAAPLDLVGRL